MNKHLKQLVAQAHDFASEYAKYSVEDVFNERYAELLMEECSIVAARELNLNAEAINTVLRNHFGVDE